MIRVALAQVVECLDRRRVPVKESERVHGDVPYYGANGQQGWIDRAIFDEPLVVVAEDGGHFQNPERGVAYRICGPSWVNNHGHVLRTTQRVDHDYLYYALRNYDFTPYISGSTRSKLTQKQLLKAEIMLPLLPEQRRIAAILDQADALRAKRRQALTLLDVLEQALYEHMIGRINWPKVKLKTITSKVGSGATPRGGQSAYKSEGVALIRSMNVHDGKFRVKNLAFLDEQQADALSNVIVQADDVLLNITGASVARVNRAPASVLPARVNQHVTIIRPSPGTVHPRILERHLISPNTKRALLNAAGGGATREAITKAQVLDLEVPFPDKSAQERYLLAATRLDDLEERLVLALAAADHLFNSLQSRAFRGEL